MNQVAICEAWPDSLKELVKEGLHELYTYFDTKEELVITEHTQNFSNCILIIEDREITKNFIEKIKLIRADYLLNKFNAEIKSKIHGVDDNE